MIQKQNSVDKQKTYLVDLFYLFFQIIIGRLLQSFHGRLPLISSQSEPIISELSEKMNKTLISVLLRRIHSRSECISILKREKENVSDLIWPQIPHCNRAV